MNESVNHESPQMSGTKLRYGPDVLRLIESPDFRAYFEPGASPTTFPRDQVQAGCARELGGMEIAERAQRAAG